MSKPLFELGHDWQSVRGDRWLDVSGNGRHGKWRYSSPEFHAEEVARGIFGLKYPPGGYSNFIYYPSLPINGHKSLSVRVWTNHPGSSDTSFFSISMIRLRHYYTRLAYYNNNTTKLITTPTGSFPYTSRVYRHVVFTLDAKSGLIYIYQDGRLMASGYDTWDFNSDLSLFFYDRTEISPAVLPFVLTAAQVREDYHRHPLYLVQRGLYKYKPSKNRIFVPSNYQSTEETN